MQSILKLDLQAVSYMVVVYTGGLGSKVQAYDVTWGLSFLC